MRRTSDQMSTASGRCCCWRHPGSSGIVPRGPQSPSGCILPPAMRRARAGTSIYMRIVNSVHHLPTRCVLRCRMGQHAQMTYVCMPSKCAKPELARLEIELKDALRPVSHPTPGLCTVQCHLHHAWIMRSCQMQNTKHTAVSYPRRGLCTSSRSPAAPWLSCLVSLKTHE